MAAVPTVPDEPRCEALLALLADWIARDGAARVLAPPVAPGPEAFPDAWTKSPAGVATLLRRLAWHAGQERRIVVRDERIGAPPTERKPETSATVQSVSRSEVIVSLQLVGEDDVAGTLAHEIGIVHAMLTRPDAMDPYRTAEPVELEIDPEHDIERGSLATVYLGLGVLAANAAYQQYSASGRFNGAYVPLEYDVVCAGGVPMSELAYLLAVQAAIRGASAPPPGLSPPQRDEVAAWLAVLRGDREALRERLGLARDLDSELAAVATRPRAEPFTDEPDVEPVSTRGKTAFRWQTHRGGLGFLAGVVLGGATAMAVAAPSIAAPIVVVASAGIGHAAGRRMAVARCTACMTRVAPDESSCRRCGAALRGDIARLADRLEAEEKLDAASH